MTRREAWLHHVSGLVVGATGLVYGWTLYFAETEDPLAAVNHPLQIPAHDLHLIAAPLMVFAVGLVWRTHVLARLRSGSTPRRRSGWLLVLSLSPMVLSGYLIQTAVDETWRRVWVFTHGATSVLWIITYVVHQLSSHKDRES